VIVDGSNKKKEKGRVSQSVSLTVSKSSELVESVVTFVRVADLRPACNQKSDFSIFYVVWCANHRGGCCVTR
jgi:hypothetical protein